MSVAFVPVLDYGCRIGFDECGQFRAEIYSFLGERQVVIPEDSVAEDYRDCLLREDIVE